MPESIADSFALSGDKGMSIAYRTILPLAAALCFANLSAELCHGLTIQFQTQANVSKPFIQLGDIAEITNGTPEMISRYEQIKLAPSPPAGGECLLDFDSVRNRILALGYSTGELEFTGSSRILIASISRPETAVTAATKDSFVQTVNYEEPMASPVRSQAERILEQVLRNGLMSSLDPSELALAELEIQFHDADAPKFAGTSHLDWKAQGWADALDQPHRLILTRNDARGIPHRVQVHCLVKMPPKTLAVKDPLPIGHVITPSDLEWTYTRDETEPLSMEQIVGMETKRSLRPGSLISTNDLRIKPYVRSRDLVTVKARQGRIVVKRTMRALGTGGLGEVVELVTLEGKDRFTAQVTGYHEAEVLEPQSAIGP